MGKELAQLADTSTPYGKLIQVLRLPLVGGGHYDWTVAAPAPLLWLLCQNCPRFNKLLQSCRDPDGQADW